MQLLPYLVQSMHRNVGCLDVLQVSLSIIFEIIGDAEPVREMWGGLSPPGAGYLPQQLGLGMSPGESGHTVINSSGD